MQTDSIIQTGNEALQAERRAAWMVVGASWVGMFMHFGSLMVNSFGVFLTTLCDQFGWTRTEVSLAFTLAMLTAMLVFLKERGPSRVEHVDHGAQDGLTRIQALKSRAFWIIVIAFLVFMAGVQACMIHLVPMLTDRGMSPARAAFAASLLGVAGIIGRIGTGYLLDRLPPTRVPVLAFALVAVGILILSAGVAGLPAIIAAMLIGLGYGADAATIPYLVSRYFGLRSFAEIYSYIFVAVPLGGAFGPALMGIGFDRLGSYQSVLLGWGLLTVVAAGLMVMLAYYPAFKAGEKKEAV